MASIIDSFRETFNDSFSFVKLIVFAIPIYAGYNMYINAKGDYSGVWTLGLFTGFFLFGFIIKTTNNVLNDRDSVMPNINPIILAIASIKGIIAIAPITSICAWIANLACSSINIFGWVDITLKSIIWLIVAAIGTTQFLLFVKKEKISEAYDIRRIIEKSGDLILGILFFLIQIVIINLPTTGFLWYTINVLFGTGPVLIGFLSYAAAFNFAVTGHYLAQLQYEMLGYDKKTF